MGQFIRQAPGLIAPFLCTVGAVSVTCAEEGLLVHYTFDEAAGDVLRDHAGNSYDARVSGAAWVESPRGHALRFDGVDDYADCGNPPALNMDGDLTLEVWLRATNTEGRNRMIFGDAAGLTINRNYNLRVDRGKLRFEHGDGKGYGVIVGEEAVLDDAAWHHLALICEYPQYYLYVDGEVLQSGPLSQPISPTQGTSRRIGGWFAGHFEGDIDEIRLYDRALPERLVLSHFRGEERTPVLRVEIDSRLNYSAQRLLLDVLCSGLTQDGCAAELRLRSPAGKVVASAMGSLRPTRPGSERWVAETEVRTEGFGPGTYEVEVTVRAPGGQQLARATAGIEYPKRPTWFGSRAGISDRVLPPYTALKAEKADGELAISPWGRSYVFGEGPFLSQVESLGAPLLAAPCRLIAKVGGRGVSWRAGDRRLSQQSPARSVVSEEFSGGDLSLSVSAEAEYDGFVKLDWRLSPREAVTLEELVLEIPLESERAKYLYTWPEVRSGALKEDYASGFHPIVWLGNEERGLSWFCESDRNWKLSEPDKAVQVVRAGDAVTLRLTMIDTPVALEAGTSLEYTFALQATPVKPITETVWDYRIVRNPWYGHSLSLPEKEVDGKPALQHFAEKGVRAMLVWRWWEAFAYPLPIGYEEQFRELVQACHAHGIKVVPYVGGFLLSELAPEAPFFRDEMAKHPVVLFPLSMPGLKNQTGYIACQRSFWQDFLVDGIAQLIDEYDVDGVYLDSTTMPWACTNAMHGCGLDEGDGRRKPVYPVFSVRETLRRTYTVVKQRKPDGIVDVHTYDCMHSGALGFATSYWNGEQLRRGPEYKPDALPLDRFRTEFMGANWGVLADLLYYVLGGYRQCCAIALLHDVPVRSENLNDLEVESALWNLREEFGCKAAEWLPYWRNAEHVDISPADCFVSLYRHPENGVLAYVSNLSKQDAEVQITLKAETLGLPAGLAARDALSAAALPMQDGTVALAIPSQDWRVIWVTRAEG